MEKLIRPVEDMSLGMFTDPCRSALLVSFRGQKAERAFARGALDGRTIQR